MSLRKCHDVSGAAAEDTAAYSPARRALKHLIMVAGHSVYIGTDFLAARQNENWLLVSYQQLPGTAESFVQHIEAGVKAAASDETSVLVFSGGYTRTNAGARSEAGSYWQVANAAQWFGNDTVAPRTLIEDRARDSLENLLFSICRFRQFTGRYPDSITVVSYDFKKERFLQVHAAALGFAPQQLDFIGTPALDPDGARKGETETLAAFRKDMYACGGMLAEKRAQRDPYSMGVPTAAQCPALRPFLSRTCLRQVYRGELPWRETRFTRADKALRAPQV